MNLELTIPGSSVVIPALIYYPSVNSGNITNAGNLAANQIGCYKITIASSVIVSRLTYRIFALSAGTFMAIGIYDALGNKVVDPGPLNMGQPIGYYSTSFTPVILPPGLYYIAWGGTSTLFQSAVIPISDIGMWTNAALELGNLFRSGTTLGVGGTLPLTITFSATITGNPTLFSHLWQG